MSHCETCTCGPEPASPMHSYAHALETVSGIPGWEPNAKADQRLVASLARLEVAPDRVEQAADNMAAKLQFDSKTGLWGYVGQNGKASFANLRATLRSWASRPPLPSQNGRRPEARGIDGFDTAERW